MQFKQSGADILRPFSFAGEPVDPRLPELSLRISSASTIINIVQHETSVHKKF